MKKSLILLLATGVLLSNSVLASDTDDEVVYSTEGYCLLANEGIAPDYLRAYSKKLGATPSKKVCNSFKEIVTESRPANWDFPQGKPYPGSIVRLSAAQIKLLKAAKKTE
jgi:hypothetical protein